MTQAYEGDNIAEIPMIAYDGMQAALEAHGGKNPEIEAINNATKNGAQQVYNQFMEGGLGESIEIRSYPFEDEALIQVVTTSIVFPETQPELYSKISSINFDKTTNTWLQLPDMLAACGLNEQSANKQIEALYNANFAGQESAGSFESAAVTGFLINRAPGKPVTQFLVELFMANESDPYVGFFLFTPENDELVELDPYGLFNPNVFEMKAMDPPLAYERGEHNATDSRLAITINTDGLEELTPGQEYLFDGMLYFQLQSFDPLSSDAYDENTMVARIRELEGDNIDVRTVTPSDEHSSILSYPTWLIVYESGSNEDSRHNVDIYFQTDSSEHRVHCSMPLDFATEYHDEVGRRLATVSLGE